MQIKVHMRQVESDTERQANQHLPLAEGTGHQEAGQNALTGAYRELTCDNMYMLNMLFAYIVLEHWWCNL